MASRAARSVWVLAGVVLSSALVAPALAARPKRSETYRRLNLEYYHLTDSLKQPDKWREAVAQRKAYIVKVEQVLRQKPELRQELEPLVARARQCIAFDGVHLLSANPEPGSGPGKPFGTELDVVSWVQDDHLRVAVANPGDGPKQATVSLRKFVRGAALADPILARAELALAGGEVTIVHFDGIPTTGKGRDHDSSFRARAALVADGKETQASALHIQGVGRWAQQLAGFVVGAGPVEVCLPTAGGPAHAHEYHVYAPSRAHCLHRDQWLPLAAPPDAKLVEADHGRFFSNRAVPFALALPQAEAYDMVRVPDLVARVHSGSLITDWRAPGPRLLVLGTATRVRRLTVPLPKEHRLDPEPLSDRPATRAAQLAARLPSQLWNVRASAQRALAAIGAPAVPRMIKLLASNSYDARKSACAVLAQIGEPAAGPLGKLLAHKDWQRRRDVAETLGKIGGRGVDLLLQATLHKNPDVRRYAILGLLASDDPRREDALELLRKDSDPAVRRDAVRALAQVVGAKRAREKLHQALKDRDPGVRAAAARALSRTDPTPRARDALVALLGDPAPGVRQAAIAAVMGWNAPTPKPGSMMPPINPAPDDRVPRIARLVADPNADVRKDAAQALAYLADPRGLPALLEGCRDAEAGVRSTAAWSLRRLLWRVPPRSDAVRRQVAATATALLRDVDDDARMCGACLLGLAKAHDGADLLIRALVDSSASVRQAAKRSLETLGHKLKALPGTHRYEVVDPAAGGHKLPDDLGGLIRRLADTNALRRAAARDALVKKGAEAVEPLTRALKDARPHVRAAAAQALAGIDLPAARAALEPLLRADDPTLARLAAQALAPSPSAGTLPAWAALLGSEDFVLRVAAAEALGRLKSPETLDFLVTQLDDPRAEVRAKIIWALGELRDPKALAPLYDRFVNERGAAASGLSPDQRRLERRRAKAKRQPVYKGHVEHMRDFDALVDALVKLGEPAIRPLILATAEGWGPLEEKAIEALVRVGKPAVPHLIRAVKAGAHGASAGAAKTLARLRPPEAIDALLAATGNPRDQYGADQAFQALIAYGAAAKDKLNPAVADARLNLTVRASAAALLLPLGDRSGLRVLESVVRTGDRLAMNRLVSRMGKLRHPAFLPLIAEALARPDAWQGVAYAAAYCGGPKAIPLLKKALEHPNKGVRYGAKTWLAKLSGTE